MRVFVREIAWRGSGLIKREGKSAGGGAGEHGVIKLQKRGRRRGPPPAS